MPDPTTLTTLLPILAEGDSGSISSAAPGFDEVWTQYFARASCPFCGCSCLGVHRLSAMVARWSYQACTMTLDTRRGILGDSSTDDCRPSNIRLNTSADSNFQLQSGLSRHAAARQYQLRSSTHSTRGLTCCGGPLRCSRKIYGCRCCYRSHKPLFQIHSVRGG